LKVDTLKGCGVTYPENPDKLKIVGQSEINHSLKKWGCIYLEFAKEAKARAIEHRFCQGGAPRLMPDDLRAMSDLDLIEALSERLIRAGQMLAGLGDSMPAIKQEIQQTTTEEVKRARSDELAKAGAKGGEGRGRRFSKLKEWAEREAVGMGGNASKIARLLMRKLPPDLANVSDDPERIIVEHLRAIKKSPS
jgi:hypothetical protein